jgi:hypothetical protein
VFAYMPPALPNGVRTPSTNTTSRTVRGMEPPGETVTPHMLLVSN